MPYYSHDPYGPPGFSAARYSALLYLGGISGRPSPRPLPNRSSLPRRYAPLPSICESPRSPSASSVLPHRSSGLPPRTLARYTPLRRYDTADLDVTSPRTCLSLSRDPPAVPLQRGRAVVRLHTRVLKERPAAAVEATRRTPGERLIEKFRLPEPAASPPKGDGWSRGDSCRGGEVRREGRGDAGCEVRGKVRGEVRGDTGGDVRDDAGGEVRYDAGGEVKGNVGRGDVSGGVGPRLVLSEVHVEVSEVFRRARRLVKFEVVVDGGGAAEQQEEQQAPQTAALLAGDAADGARRSSGPDGAAEEARGRAGDGAAVVRVGGGGGRKNLLPVDAPSKPVTNDCEAVDKTSWVGGELNVTAMKILENGTSRPQENKIELPPTQVLNDSGVSKSKPPAKVPKDNLEKSLESSVQIKTRRVIPTKGTNSPLHIEDASKKPKEQSTTSNTTKSASPPSNINSNKLIPIEMGHPHDAGGVLCETATTQTLTASLQANTSQESPKSKTPSTSTESQALKSSIDTFTVPNKKNQNEISKFAEENEPKSLSNQVENNALQDKDGIQKMPPSLAKQPGVSVTPTSIGDSSETAKISTSAPEKKQKIVQKPPPLNLKAISVETKIPEKGQEKTSSPDSAKILRKTAFIDSNFSTKDKGIDSPIDVSSPDVAPKKSEKPSPWGIKSTVAENKTAEAQKKPSTPDSPKKILGKQAPTACTPNSSTAVLEIDSPKKVSPPAVDMKKVENLPPGNLKTTEAEKKAPDKAQERASTPNSPKKILGKQTPTTCTPKSSPMDLEIKSPKIASPPAVETKKMESLPPGNLKTTEAEKKAPDKAQEKPSTPDSPKNIGKLASKVSEKNSNMASPSSEVSLKEGESPVSLTLKGIALEGKTPEKAMEKPLTPESPKKNLGKNTALASNSTLTSKDRTKESSEAEPSLQIEPKKRQPPPLLIQKRPATDKKLLDKVQDKSSPPVSPKKIISAASNCSPSSKDSESNALIALSSPEACPKKMEMPSSLDRKSIVTDKNILQQTQRAQPTPDSSKSMLTDKTSITSASSAKAIVADTTAVETSPEMSPKKLEKPPPLNLKSAVGDKKVPAKSQEKQPTPDSPKKILGKPESPLTEDVSTVAETAVELPQVPLKKQAPPSKSAAAKKKVSGKTQDKSQTPDSPKRKLVNDASSSPSPTSTTKSTAAEPTAEATPKSLQSPQAEHVSSSLVSGIPGKQTNTQERSLLDKSKMTTQPSPNQITRESDDTKAIAVKDSPKVVASKKQPPRPKESEGNVSKMGASKGKTGEEAQVTGADSVLTGPTKIADKDKEAGTAGGPQSAAGDAGGAPAVGEGLAWGGEGGRAFGKSSESTSSGSTSIEDTSSEESTSSSEEEDSYEDDPEVLLVHEAVARASVPGTSVAPATTLPRFRDYTEQDFLFLKVLGKGSFGKVFLATLRDADRHYAIKCLKKQSVIEEDDVECTLIERKVLLLATAHPYLCHLFCTFQTESHLFFVMEYLNGGDLMFHIQRTGRFEQERARFYAAEVVSGLKFLHKKGIIYRDLKLDNLLLDFHGHVRIADFGMCKLQIFLDRTADTFCGTPDYIAPEIIKGYRYNQTVDWWSFGVLLYEMLVGQSPFQGCDDEELFWCICNQAPVYPRYLTHEARDILSKFLTQDSDRRLGASCCPHGDVCDQPFFRPIDWWRLERRQLEPPFKPVLAHRLDLKYFDRTFTCERAKLTPTVEKRCISDEDQLQFSDFTYTNPNATD